MQLFYTEDLFMPWFNIMCVSGEADTTRIGGTDIAIMRGETIGTATMIDGADPATGGIPRREDTRRRGDTNPILRHPMGKGPAGRIWLVPDKLHSVNYI